MSSAILALMKFNNVDKGSLVEGPLVLNTLSFLLEKNISLKDVEGVEYACSHLYTVFQQEKCLKSTFN